MANLSWKEFASLSYANQGKAFLNAYWDDCGESMAESVWEWANKFAELDLAKQKEGCDLDEFGAHRFLESIGETLTVKEMRQQLKETDLDFNKRIALIEYCLWKNNKGINDFLAKPQGDPSEVERAQALLEEVQAALKESKAKADAAREAEAAAKKAADEAAAAAEEAKKREADAKAKKEAALAAAAEAKEKEEQAAADAASAKVQEEQAASDASAAKVAADELKAALADLKAQEDAYNNKTEDLKKKSETGGVVSRNRAKNELAQHLEEDPLPLRTAKLTTEAATRKADKTKDAAEASHASAVAKRKEADESHAAAVQSRQEADQAAAEASDAADAATAARQASEEAAEAAAAAAAAAAEAKAEAEAAVEACIAKYDEAEAYLEEVKKNAVQRGHIWWVERELHEAKKYMPMRKGGIAKK